MSPVTEIKVRSKGRMCQPTGGASFKAQPTGKVVLLLKLLLSPSWFDETVLNSYKLNSSSF